MKKKLITILAMLAIVSGFAMAAQEVSVPETSSGAGDGVPVTAYTETAYSVDTTGDSATVVADADSKEFVFALEAQNSTGWVSADGQDVFDTTWDVRTGFNVNFRVRATAGTINEEQTVGTTVTVGKLTHTELASTKVDKNVVVSAATAGSFFTINSAGGATGAPGADAVSAFSFDTFTGHYYGLAANAANDSVSFNIAYTGDTEAPAGRYESTVTVAYAAL